MPRVSLGTEHGKMCSIILELKDYTVALAQIKASQLRSDNKTNIIRPQYLLSALVLLFLQCFVKGFTAFFQNTH